MREGRTNKAAKANRLVLHNEGSSPGEQPLHSVRISLDLIEMLLYHVGERRDIHWAAYSK